MRDVLSSLLLRLLVLVACAFAVPVVAQQDDLVMGQIRSPVLTIDPDRLFTESLFGQRVNAEILAQTEALGIENRRIEAALTEEERSLTLRRPTMTVEAFRAEASAFDAKVQAIRRAQDTKERDLQQGLAVGRDAFIVAASPVLGQMMAESGAAVILDQRSVFLGVAVVDITDEAITAINAAIGDGLAQDPVPAPEPVPAPAPDAQP